MVGSISSWAQGIIVAVIVATIIEMLLPNNGNGKYIKTVVGIFVLFSIISPVISKFKDKNEFTSSDLALYEKNSKSEAIKTSASNINTEETIKTFSNMFYAYMKVT